MIPGYHFIIGHLDQKFPNSDFDFEYFNHDSKILMS